MNRLGLLSPGELRDDQKDAYEVLRAYTTSSYGDKFLYKDKEGRFVGPFGIHMHHPELAKAFIGFAKALRTVDLALPHDVRETCILGVGSRLGAAYESYAHESLSGFTVEEQRQLHTGTCPAQFSGAQKVAYRLALELGKPGPLAVELWEEAKEIRKTLGIAGATAVVHYVGFYSYVSTILNAFDAKVPREV